MTSAAGLIDNKRSAIKFSWHGNSECFEKFDKPLFDGIIKNSIAWKHDDSFPIKIKYQLKFVKFNENLVLTSGVPQCCSRIAFVHVYFFNSATVEEYRNSLPEFAEWFSLVKSDSWLVVFDSTRAREQKARGHVLERIKSDVSGSQNRIFELNGLIDLKAMNVLINSIITYFTASLDSYSNALKSVLITLKDDRSISELINCQFKLCFFYWSLGMTENALSEFENLDNTITNIFNEAATSMDEKNCAALISLKSIDGRKESPLLEWQMKRSQVENTNSLINLRSFVLTHQLLAGLFSFEIRRKNGDSLTLDSLNNYFASALFRNTYNLLIWLKNNVFLQNSIYDQIYQSCLSIAWTHEIFELSKVYGNFQELESATEDASKLLILNSEAWLFLHNQQIKKLDWLDSWKLKETGNDKTLLGQFADIQANKCREHCINSLEKTLSTLKYSKWTRNFALFRLKLAQSRLESNDKSDILTAIEEILQNNKLPISFIYSLLKQQFGDPIDILQSSPKVLSKFNSSLCKSILSSNEPVTQQVHNNAPAQLFNFDCEHFPFRLISIHSSFIVVRVNKPFELSLSLHSDYNIPLDECVIGAVFKPFDPKSVQFSFPSFECTMQENNRISRFQCVREGHEARKITSQSLYSKSENDLECTVVRNQRELVLGGNVLKFEAVPHTSSNFVLSHLFIRHPSNFEFVLAVEHEKIKSQINGCFCFVDIKLPNVELVNDSNFKFYAGVAQELNLRLYAGSRTISSQSTLKACFLDSDESVEFLKSDGTWSPEFECELSKFEAMSDLLLKVRFCTTINQMNYSSTNNFSFAKNLKVQWQDREWTLELKFVSILSIKTMTSILEDRTLFETELQRCDGNDSLLIVPLDANMASVDEEEENLLPADLLNDCLEPIYADSTYRLIWRLSFAKSNAPVNHNLSLKYKIQPNEDYNSVVDDEMQQIICSRDYTFKNTLSFSITPVEYEICARILSEKPQSVICRAESTCDFVISLRMLTKNKAETVIIALEADPEHWTLVDKFKVVQVKDNGLGQTSFNVIPRVGYLPYPAVYIHRVNNGDHMNERDLTNLNESKLFGERVTVFNRSEAKQIHVLGAFNPNEDSDSINLTSTAKSLRAQAKERLSRLFD